VHHIASHALFRRQVRHLGFLLPTQRLFFGAPTQALGPNIRFADLDGLATWVAFAVLGRKQGNKADGRSGKSKQHQSSDRVKGNQGAGRDPTGARRSATTMDVYRQPTLPGPAENVPG
jgi:hypothetical protein